MAALNNLRPRHTLNVVLVAWPGELSANGLGYDGDLFSTDLLLHANN